MDLVENSVPPFFVIFPICFRIDFWTHFGLNLRSRIEIMETLSVEILPEQFKISPKYFPRKCLKLYILNFLSQSIDFIFTCDCDLVVNENKSDPLTTGFGSWFSNYNPSLRREFHKMAISKTTQVKYPTCIKVCLNDIRLVDANKNFCVNMYTGNSFRVHFQ